MLWSVPWQDAGPLRESGEAEIVSSEHPSAALYLPDGQHHAPLQQREGALRRLVDATDKKTIIETAYAGAVLLDTDEPTHRVQRPAVQRDLPTYESISRRQRRSSPKPGSARATR